MTRKRFLGLTAGALPAIVLLGCGDDEDGLADTETTGPGTTGTAGTTGTTAPATTTTATTTTTGDETTGTTTTTGPTDDTTTGPGATTGTTAADETAGTTTTGAAACDDVMEDLGPPSMGPPHMHVLEVPAEDVAAAAEVTYETSLDAGHFHEVTVTAEMFDQLAAGETVMTDTVPDATGHTHPVTLACQ